MKRLGICLVILTLILGLSLGDLDDLRLLSPDEVPPNLRGYSIINNYCWLVAHTSGKIGSTIVIDGGTAKYRLNVNGTDVAVPDLNSHTVSLDLSRDFNVNEPKLTILATKAGNTTGNWTTSDAPVVNRGGMWVIGNDTIIQGGHFYTDNRINTSRWHVTKDAIPGYSMWRFTDATNEGKWHEEPFHNGTEIIRTVSGASACTHESCYWLGGYISTRTSSKTPITDWSTAQRGMLVYDFQSKTLRNESMDGYGRGNEGFEYGTLDWIPNNGKGLLVSLMGERQAINSPNETSDYLNGESVSLQHVMLYDIERRVWYNQTTYGEAFISQPPVRTRFCSVLVNDQKRNVWDLWLYGGLLTSSNSQGIHDLYVLSMPSFTWVRIEPKREFIGEENLRSHSCHAVGNQLVVIGGSWPRGAGKIDQRWECTRRLVNVLDMNEADGANPAEYKQPSTVQKEVAGLKSPHASGGWVDQRIKDIWPSPIGSGLPVRFIVAIVVCVILGILLLGGGIWWWRKWQASKEPTVQRAGASDE